ncbi:TIGR03085 family metal-binding protein [Pseudokineococcus basanitobsidens]|uniref:TIGR03085 family metal-binding protein n=1 Tax=Pseudokineococcus basanitobsidens TaxID=1926649 RepID=A0ABU8RI77_9ACTN
MTASSDERAVLAAALAAAGPDAPTLCEGWTTRDLAAHLVVREGRPDVALGMVLPPLAGHAARVTRRVRRQPYDDLVASFADGPPRLSPFRVPPLDAAVNSAEHFVHAEDVRRAGDAPVGPRDLSPAVRSALWATVRLRARGLYRGAAVGVELATPEGRSVVRRAPEGAGTVVVRGDAGEVVLFTFGRGAVAHVELDGSPQDVAVVTGVRRSV